jgi:WD40 repeat protein
MFTLDDHIDGICCLAFSPTGKVLASGDQWAGLNLWELRRRRLRRGMFMPGAYDDHEAKRMMSVAYSSDGKMLVTTTGTFPPFPRVWRASDMTLLCEWEEGWSNNCAVFLPDGRTVVSAGSGDDEDYPLYCWDVEKSADPTAGERRLNGRPRTPRKPTLIHGGHTKDIFAMDCSAEGMILTGSADGSARLWDMAKRQEVAARRFRACVNSVAISPDGKLAAIAAGRSVYLWDLTNPKSTPSKLTGHTDLVNAVAFHPGGRILGSGGRDGIVRLWDVQSGSERQAFDWGMYWVGALAFAPDGDTAAAGGGSCKVVVFDVET